VAIVPVETFFSVDKFIVPNLKLYVGDNESEVMPLGPFSVGGDQNIIDLSQFYMLSTVRIPSKSIHVHVLSYPERTHSDTERRTDRHRETEKLSVVE